MDTAHHGPAAAARALRGGHGWGVLPGLVLAVAVAAAATGLASVIPLVGGPVLGIVLGVAVATVSRPGVALVPGIAFAGRNVLQLAVVVLGAQLSLGEVAKVGVDSLPVLLGTLAACLALAPLIGRALGISRDLRTLIGVGTGICGASAIAAVTPVIGAAELDVAFAISTIFLFNVAAVLLFPVIGHALGLGQHAFGVFAGTAVNDTSSVVAAATSYGHSAARTAVVVKLTRTLMIVPICVGLAAGAGKVAPGPGRLRRLAGQARVVPGFLVAFLVLAAVNSAGAIPASSGPALSRTATMLITVALAGVGLSIDLGGLRRTGWRPLALGAALWVTVGATSLVLQSVTGL